MLPDVSRLGTSAEVAERLLMRHGIATVDGALLGGRRHVRISFSGTDTTFDELELGLRQPG